MARKIQSPGVQISEIDLSLRVAGNPVTTILVPGFAPKGPTSEPIRISSLSDFEQIYGQPTNSAERYFYHSVKASFQSSADILVYRLPYGLSSGVDTSDSFSALVYPVVSYINGLSSTSLVATSANYFFGKPTHLKLTQEQYLSILRGDGFTWSNNTSGTKTFSGITSLSAAGVIILNKSQSTINSRFEGYYVATADNTNLNPATDYDGVGKVFSINSTATAITDYLTLPDARLDFTLSAATTGPDGSLSQVIEDVPSFDISSNQFDDTIILSVFKLRQSVFSPDTIALGYVLEENYVGSFDANRQQNATNGGPAESFFLETLDDSSLQVTTLISPFISNKNAASWLNPGGIPQKKVRFLTPRLGAPLAGESAQDYTDRVGAPEAIVNEMRAQYGDTNALFPVGDYTNVDLNTKFVGNVPAKLNKLFEKVENVDIYPINLVIEAGLGTIYANSFNPATSGYFDDAVTYDSAFQALTAQRTTSLPTVASNYLAVASEYTSFAAVKRKDNLVILDPLTNILVSGGIKTIDDTTKNFSSDIYWPLKNQFSGINTSYACTFGTCVRVTDIASNLPVWVPSSGFVAAAMANTDTNYQPWYAPAGFSRGVVQGITDVAYYPKQKQRDDLYKININPIAFFPAEGFVIFGQKTLQKIPSAFDRINVRRLFLNLEAATRDTVKYFVFEPNTLFTRTQVVNTLTPLFENAKNTQGIYDYLIICDERNNTAAVIDDNSLVVDIYIKPVRTAEYILANFYATRTGTNFQEIVS